MTHKEFLRKVFIDSKSIKLEGEAAAEFARRLFFPTKEEIEHHNAILDKIDKKVQITETEDGFIAEVEDLDLSFLSDKEDDA